MRRAIALLVMMLLAVPATVSAQVRDQANFFTPNAVERANQLISQMRQQTRHGVMVETIPSVPSNMRSQLQSMGNDRFFSELTTEMARQSGVSGVYVLISRDPSYLKVAVGDETQRAGLFTAADRDRLRDTLLSSFRSRNFDQGLLDAVAMVQRTMTSNAQTARSGGAAATGAGAGAAASSGDRTVRTFPGQQRTGTTATPAPAPAPAPQQRSTGRGWLFWLLLIGGGFLLLRFILKRMANRAQSGYGMGQPGYGNQNVPPPLPGQQYPPQYGNQYPGQVGGGMGGGFGRGVLGGLLGGAAGGWLYDKMGRRQDTGAFPGQGTTPAHTDPDPFAAPPDRDFSVSSGGEFGDAGGGGGGDWGGGGDTDNNGGGSF